MDTLIKNARENPGNIIAGIALSLAVTVIPYALNRLRKSGLFQVILFDVKDLPSGQTLMLKSSIGNYNKALRPAFSELLELLDGRKCEDEMWGIYYDNPGDVGWDNCGFSVGVPIDDVPELEPILAQAGFVKVTGLPANYKTLHTSFPFTGMLSVIISTMRVYSAFLGEYARLRKLGLPMPKGLVEPKGGIFVEITSKRGVAEFYFLDIFPSLAAIRPKNRKN